jgi:phosphohistidine phosphatase SixA
VTERLLLVRHAEAISRSRWTQEDELRPLTDKGWDQARGLVPLLSDLVLTRLLSSPAVRCWQTLEPLAEDLGLEIEHEPRLWEGASVRDARLLLDEVGDGTVLSSHGDLIPDLLNHLIGEGMEAVGRDCKKGSTWVLERTGSRYVRGTYLPPPKRKS